MRTCKTCQTEIERGYYCQPCMVERNKVARRKYASKLYDWYVEQAPYNAINELYETAEYQFLADGAIFRKDARLTRQAIREALEDGAVLPTELVMDVQSKQQMMVEAI